jgi:hypothetical protein
MSENMAESHRNENVNDPDDKGNPSDIAELVHGDQAREEKYAQPDAVPFNTSDTLISTGENEPEVGERKSGN